MTAPWCLDRLRRLLVHFHGQTEYEVALDECRTSAAMLDWIFQVAEKDWATDEIMADLIRAFARLLRPQQTLCSGGQERGPIDVADVLSVTLSTYVSEDDLFDRRMP